MLRMNRIIQGYLVSPPFTYHTEEQEDFVDNYGKKELNTN